MENEMQYYQLIIDFLDNINSSYSNNSDTESDINKTTHMGTETIDYSFINYSKSKINFGISLWMDKYYFPRVTLSIKHPNKDEYYEALDEYNGGKDIDVQNLLLYIKAILSHPFVFEYDFLDKKEVGITYSYYIYSNKNIERIESRFSKQWLVFPWKRKNIIKKRYEFKPWI